MEDSNVYYKEGKKYKPFGVICKNYLPDGIYYVHHTKHFLGITNVDRYLSGIFKMNNDVDYIDIPKICSMYKYTEYVLNSEEFKEIINSKSYTPHDLVAKIVKLVVELNDKLEKKEKDGIG